MVRKAGLEFTLILWQLANSSSDLTAFSRTTPERLELRVMMDSTLVLSETFARGRREALLRSAEEVRRNYLTRGFSPVAK